MSKCMFAVEQCYSFTSDGIARCGAFRNYCICLMCSRPKTMRRGFRQLHLEFWSFTFRITVCLFVCFQILGKAPHELQESSTIERTFCQGELFNQSFLSSDNSHVCIEPRITLAWKRKYNYIMWLPRKRERAQGTRSPISAFHTELVME